MKKDWRSMQWSDLEHREKFWLCITIVVLIVVVALSIWDAKAKRIPDWAAIIILPIMFLCLYKLFPMFPWAFGPMNMDEDCDDDDDDDDKDE